MIGRIWTVSGQRQYNAQKRETSVFVGEKKKDFMEEMPVEWSSDRKKIGRNGNST